MLLRLLEQSKEPLVLCVAAHDIGEYVRHYPHGKKYVKSLFNLSFATRYFRAIDKLGGKVIIMRLLENPDSNVRYQGLLCVQKLMVHNW
jgi:V-type H+-transporting ATPase subunit H